MSYILDALKKSERDRTLIRGVGFGDAGRRWSPHGDWSLGAIAVGAGALAVVAIAAVVGLRDRSISMEAEPTVGLSQAPVTRDAAGADTTSLHTQARITEESRTTTTGTAGGLDTGAGGIRFLSALAPEFQRSLPAMTVNIHVYSPEESQRILYINNRQFRRGDEIPGGVIVEEIVADGVVLQWRGQRFKLPRPS